MARARLPRRVALDSFRYFRRAWSPAAAYHLTAARHAPAYADRLASVAWLTIARVPLSGAAQSVRFPGRPYPGLARAI